MLVLNQSFAQDISSHIQAMKGAYASSGSIVSVGDDAILIEPKMPSPVCALPLNQGGKTA
jgi:hypothetical protein